MQPATSDQIANVLPIIRLRIVLNNPGEWTSIVLNSTNRVAKDGGFVSEGEHGIGGVGSEWVHGWRLFGLPGPGVDVEPESVSDEDAGLVVDGDQSTATWVVQATRDVGKDH